MSSNDDGSGRKDPSQIPLLDDVVEPGRKKATRRRRQKENFALDLNPEPPKTRDLFSGNLEPVHTNDPAPPVPVAPNASEPSVDPPEYGDHPVDAGSDDPEANSPGPMPDPETGFMVDEIDIYEDLVGIPESELRAQADQVVENLLQEYSVEILQRLREELNSLLDDLRTDDDATP